jgi:hypothetical protein
VPPHIMSDINANPKATRRMMDCPEFMNCPEFRCSLSIGNLGPKYERPARRQGTSDLHADDGVAPKLLLELVVSAPRPVSPQRLKGEALADRPENVALDDAGRGHRLCDCLADMGESYRTTGQENGVDVLS